MPEEPVTAQIIGVGDLEYKVRDYNMWRRREFPCSMLIQFESDEAVRRAILEGRVLLSFDEVPTP